MDCLWNVCGLLGMDFSVSLIGFPQPLMCVGRLRRPWPPERDGRALLALIDCIYSGYSIWDLFGIVCDILQRPQCNYATARNSNSSELTVDEKTGDVINWNTRQM